MRLSDTSSTSRQNAQNGQFIVGKTQLNRNLRKRLQKQPVKPSPTSSAKMLTSRHHRTEKDLPYGLPI